MFSGSRVASAGVATYDANDRYPENGKQRCAAKARKGSDHSRYLVGLSATWGFERGIGCVGLSVQFRRPESKKGMDGLGIQ